MGNLASGTNAKHVESPAVPVKPWSTVEDCVYTVQRDGVGVYNYMNLKQT